MTKLLRTLALTAVLAGGTTAMTVATAQEKGKTTKKEDDKKKAKKAGGSIEVLENKAGRFYFKVVNADGKLLAMSGIAGFAEKADAVKAVEDLKEILDTAKITYPPKKADDKDEKMEKKKDEKKKG